MSYIEEMVVYERKSFQVDLQSMASSTAYGWALSTLPAGMFLWQMETIPTRPGVAPVIQRFHLIALGAEPKVQLDFVLIQPFSGNITDTCTINLTVVPDNANQFAPYSENTTAQNRAVYGFPDADNSALLKYGYPCASADATLKYGYPCTMSDSRPYGFVNSAPVADASLKYGYPCTVDAALKYGFPCTMNTAPPYGFFNSAPAADASLKYGYPCTVDASLKYGYPCTMSDSRPYGFVNSAPPADASLKYGYPCTVDASLKYGFPCTMNAAQPYGFIDSASANADTPFFNGVAPGANGCTPFFQAATPGSNEGAPVQLGNSPLVKYGFYNSCV
ncbi:MAG: hypothetical protein LBV33_06180 [Lachnospiraceae bacterium]|nr:hypothetical protein [Lachnospiraceae bacterium]